jgi:hypothetical protein
MAAWKVRMLIAWCPEESAKFWHEFAYRERGFVLGQNRGKESGRLKRLSLGCGRLKRLSLGYGRPVGLSRRLSQEVDRLERLKSRGLAAS